MESGAPVGSPRGRGLGLYRPKRRVRTRSPLLRSWRSQSRKKKKKSKTQTGACALCACLCCGPAPRPLVLQPPRFALSGGGGFAASNRRSELKVRCAGPPPPPPLSHHLGAPHLPPKANGSACSRTRPGGREQKTRRRASRDERGAAREGAPTRCLSASTDPTCAAVRGPSVSNLSCQEKKGGDRAGRGPETSTRMDLRAHLHPLTLCPHP